MLPIEPNGTEPSGSGFQHFWHLYFEVLGGVSCLKNGVHTYLETEHARLHCPIH